MWHDSQGPLVKSGPRTKILSASVALGWKQAREHVLFQRSQRHSDIKVTSWLQITLCKQDRQNIICLMMLSVKPKGTVHLELPLWHCPTVSTLWHCPTVSTLWHCPTVSTLWHCPTVSTLWHYAPLSVPSDTMPHCQYPLTLPHCQDPLTLCPTVSTLDWTQL